MFKHKYKSSISSIRRSGCSKKMNIVSLSRVSIWIHSFYEHISGVKVIYTPKGDPRKGRASLKSENPELPFGLRDIELLTDCVRWVVFSTTVLNERTKHLERVC